MKNKLLLILTNPLFLSLILTIILFLVLPPLFSKYKVDLIKKEKSLSKNIIQYCDLNNDGYSEKIISLKGYEDRTSIVVREKGLTLDQWTLNGRLTMQELFIADFNNDGLKEIFLFTIFKNKILLNCFNPFENKRYIVDQYIDDFFPKNGEKSCTLMYSELIDMNSDNKDEYVFAFSTGFSVSPRRMYNYNFETGILKKSPQSCSTISSVISLTSDKNKSPMFIVSSAAFGNCDTNSNYPDKYSWLTIYDSDLNYEFNPIKIGFYPSNLSVSPFRINNQIFLAALNIYFGKENYLCSIALYDLEGKKIKEKSFPYTSEWYSAKLLSKGNNYKNIFVLKGNGTIEELDEDLNISKKQKVLEIRDNKSLTIDIDLDNEDEFIFDNSTLEKVTISRNDFSDPVIIDVPGNNNLLCCSVLLNGNEKPQLFLNFDNFSYYYEYYKNPLYNFRFIFYGLIYLGIFGFLFALQKAQKYRVEQKFKAEKEIAELQMRSIKNQTDPHFTLNIINSIGSLFAKQETDKANYVFGKYSKLLRSTILSSDKIITTLDDELEYVENYLSLEQFRFKEGFDFKIEKEEKIKGETKIPKMLIHTFVENAIKHGIKHIEERGELFISISNGTDAYKIKIRDNGIGRTKAKEINSFGTGKGLEIMNQILDLYYTLEKVRITYKVEDLTNGLNESAGTEVLIIIPILKLK